MNNLKEAQKIVNDELEGYKPAFHQLVKKHAEACLAQDEKYCDFFVDIASMMVGSWLLTAEVEFDDIPEFKEFDWCRRLGIEEGSMPEDEFIALLDEVYKIGYIWLETELGILKKEINNVEIRLYHNGSLEYQPL